MFAKGLREERGFSFAGIEKGPSGLYVSSSGNGGAGSPPTGGGQPSESECAVGRQRHEQFGEGPKWKQGGGAGHSPVLTPRPCHAVTVNNTAAHV